jgi:succinate dehydrogenase / fumarate reductase iron-sulfur subunit
MSITRTAEPTLDGHAYARVDFIDDQGHWQDKPYNRFESCIECGMCISACPTMAATTRFLGPAPLAALYRAGQESPNGALTPDLEALADGEQAVWRCHNAFECTEVCPQSVDPGGAIMALRRQLIGRKVKKLFGG